MTRKQLIKAIHDSKDNWSCPDSGHCDLPEKEKNAGDCCMKCAENQLAEYEAKVRKDAIEELLKKLCIGCAYLKGTKCEIKGGCPCSIGQSEIIRSANKVLEQLKE